MRVIAVKIADWNPNDELFNALLSTLDLASIERTKAYRFRDDAKRSIIGRLLPRYILTKHFNVDWKSIEFGATPENRPFYTSPENIPVSDYNVSHDGDYVLIGYTCSPNSRIGVDITRLALPRNTTHEEFYEAFETQMHKSESVNLNAMPDHESKLRRLLSLWTLKEAYTKALGFGLGFDFSRVAYEFPYDNSNASSEQKVEVASARISGLKVDDRVLHLGYVTEGVLNRWDFYQGQLDGHLIAVSLRDGSREQYEQHSQTDWLDILKVDDLVKDVLSINKI
ncbi:4'-phosphopantetheinyl transferase [Wallemia mellicola]|nr:hypothetical protein E3Q24_03403 [Wallemia mellicola]TIC41016.1 4'-phosphopantetheinyl transferase [Wallemia mellicola]